RKLKQNSITHCPEDIVVFTNPGSNFAVVNWNVYNNELLEDKDNIEIEFDNTNLSPGSTFPIGKTSVTYTIKSQGNELAKCDFIVDVKDNETPTIECPGDIYIMTQFNQNYGIAKWNVPNAYDNTETEVSIKQISGPNINDRLNVGQYTVTYEAVDVFNNKGI